MKTSTGRMMPLALAAALLPSLASQAHAAPTDAQKCEVAVELASAKYVQCRLRAESNFTKTGDATKRGDALLKCSDKLASDYGKAQSKYPGSCPMTETASAFDVYLAQCSDTAEAAAGGASLTLACLGQSFPATGQISCWNSSGSSISCAGTGHDGELQAGATLAYVDNGDGTVTDVNTGLMWEKLSDDGSIHDKDNYYTWDDAFAVKVATLNLASFAGHSDWRVPNVKELQSIVNYKSLYPGPTVAAAFNSACAPSCTVTTCSCTVSSYYWSSSSYAGYPAYAWYVYFNYGNVFTNCGTDDFYVRAVRAGS